MEQDSSLKTLPCDSINQCCDLERKKKKLLEKLKKEKLQNMKGSSSILDKLKEQRQSYENRLTDQKEKIIYKQHLLVKKLNTENQILNEQKTHFEQELVSSNVSEQNKSLKDQLKKSQSISSKMLTDLKNSRKEIYNLTKQNN
ncbi:hypothetical protein BpHYR1_039432 [Brachionus plicatilis]|uniref:Uncharacterized protein n=1 Tax=Brachionus plicatilis TaxID=10195 RepID=A0A3M7T513_BRAPC|nr:hypothetical protein BpHYR1_039432 [Brachionus plicatilis]